MQVKDIQLFCRPVLLHLLAKTKRGALLSCDSAQAHEMQAVFESYGFFAITVLPESLAPFGFDEKEAFVFAGICQKDAQLTKDLYLKQRSISKSDGDISSITYELSEILGYPKCCTEQYLKLSSFDDKLLIRSSYYRTIGKIDPLCGFFSRFAPSFLQHAPCTLNCKASGEIARKVLKTAREYFPEFAKSYETALGKPVMFFDPKRYLRLDEENSLGKTIHYKKLLFAYSEQEQIDKNWLENFKPPATLDFSDSAKLQKTDDNLSAKIYDTSPERLILIHPNKATPFKTSPSVMFVESFPNEQEQTLTSFFARLYVGDLVQNGIQVEYLQYHQRPGDDEYNEGMIDEALEIALKNKIDQIYFFRTYQPEMAKKFADRLPNVPRILIDNTTPSRAFEMTNYLPILDRARFVRTVIGISSGIAPKWLGTFQKDSINTPIWQLLKSQSNEGVFINPEHPLNFKVSPYRLNKTVTRQSYANEIAAQPGCHYQKPCQNNKHFKGLDLSNVPYNKGCSFCTTHNPGYKALSKKEQLASLTYQLEEFYEVVGGNLPVRILDQGALRLLNDIIDFAESKNSSGITLLVDLRVDELLANKEYLRKLLKRLSDTRHKIDLFCIGFENFSQLELNRFNKGIKVEQNIEAIEFIDELSKEFPKCLSRGKASSGFILFTPWTRVSDLEKNLEVIKNYDFKRFRSGAIFTKLRLYQDSPIYQLCKNDGLQIDEYSTQAFDKASETGYSPEEPWKFANSDVAKIYQLLSFAATKSEQFDEAGLLKFTIDYVSQKTEDSSDNEAYLSGIQPFLGGSKSITLDLKPHIDNTEQLDIPAKTKAAIKDLEQKINLGHDLFNSELKLARQYVSINNLQKALGHFVNARKLNPKHPDPLLRIGELLARLGKVDQAVSVLKLARENFSDKSMKKNVDQLLKKIIAK